MMWPLVALEKVADVVGGSTPRRGEQRYWGPGHFWVTPTDLPMPGDGILDLEHTEETITEEGLGSISAKVLPVGTVLYSTRATIGKLAIANVPVVTNQGFNNLIAGPEIYNRYLAYALQFFTPDISRLAGSTTFKEVSRSSLRGFKIPLPPVKEQHRIVELLDQADALRCQRREADAKAARILPALFLKMFGDPATNSMGWPKCTVGDVLLSADYGSSTRASEDGKGLPLIRMGNVGYDGSLLLNDLKYVELSEAEAKKYRLHVGDILFNRTNSLDLVGKTGIWNGELDAVVASYFIRLRVDTSKLDPAFLWAYMNSEFMKRVLRATARGAIGQANINTSELRAFPLYVPPLSLQKEFVSRVCAIKALLPAFANDSDIDDMFSVLLQKAFAGQLTAKWRQAHTQELRLEVQQQANALNLPIPKEVVA